MQPAFTRLRRRIHPVELKTRLVNLCQPGVSVSAVALANGINANLLRRWIVQFAGMPIASPPLKSVSLVPVHVATSTVHASTETIDINIQRSGSSIVVRWPMSGADACARLLGSLLK